MFSQTFMLSEYVPLMKSEQSGKLRDQMAVVDGRNFAWRGGSVFSAYGAVIAANTPTLTMRHPGQFMIQNVVYYFDTLNVRRRNADGTWTVVYTYPVPVTPIVSSYTLTHYQWTHAYVGTRHWYCHPSVGLIYFDQFTGVWGSFRDTCWNGPIYAICMADNRLVVLLEDVVAWSWFDQGEKFDHLWQSGSGAQSLALIKYGQPYSVRPYNDGFVTFTSMGVMVSVPERGQTLHPEGDRIMVGALVFNHQEVTFEDTAIGPAAITHVGDTFVVWLSQNGFRAFQPTQGGGFGGMATWQAPMSAFYVDTVLVDIEGAVSDHVMMQYCRELNSVFVSVRGGNGIYNSAHVYQIDFERWGSFDEPHRCVGHGYRTAVGSVNKQLASYVRFEGSVFDIDNLPGSNSWVKFSPVRLQMPQEQALPATTIISVQEIRLGTDFAKGQTTANLPFGLVSGWATERFRSHVATKCDLLISGGWDDNTQNLDQGEYAMLRQANLETAIYVCDVTGITHSIYAVCSAPDHHFDISSIEASFFFAGQL